MLILSASQAETYDPEQPGGCPRRWWFERVERRQREDTASTRDGHAGHALFATYLREGHPLPKRARMLKAVRGALHRLPPPAPGRLIESRFDGQPSHTPDGQRVRLDIERTLWLGGAPWDGYVDLRWRDGDTVTVWDHKFSSDIDTYAKPADKLIRTVQMPLYALDSTRLWPDAERFRLVHLYVSRRGVHSFIREQTVSREQIEERGFEIGRLAARIQETAMQTRQEDVPSNRKACDAYGGCPHQSVCTAFRRKPVYELSEEEKALFGAVAEGTGAKPAPAEVVKFEKPGDDRTRPHSRKALEAAARGDIAEAERLQAAFEADSLAADGNIEEAKQVLSEAPAPPDVSIPAPVASVPTAQPEAAPLATSAGKVTGVSSAGQCATCPHPAHPGAQCMGKRGRGQCRCGVQATAEREQDAPALKIGHLAVCVQADGGKWLCMDGCTAGQTNEPHPLQAIEEAGIRHAQEKFGPGGPEDLTKPHGWPVPILPEPRPALRLEVEFGPRAATILEKLAPALLELLKGR